MSVENSPVRNHIFISYRHDDARGASGRLYDWLRIAFGHARVFRDVHIGIGKWQDKIDAALARSVACLAVIGPRWADADNLPRLHDEGDPVRHELVTALASTELAFVPTLVEDAQVPKVGDLPTVLRPMLDWQAHKITEQGWEDDTRRLIAEIAKVTRLPIGPDLETLLRNVGAAHVRVAELEHTRHLQTDQIQALRRTVDDLTHKLAEASGSERSAITEACAALAQGDSIAAEEAFEREYESRMRAAGEARHMMAEAARNVANLALMHDIGKAVSFYRKALEAQTDDAATALLLGQALMESGELQAAEAAFSLSLSIAIKHGATRGEIAAHIGLGDVFRRTRDTPAATAAFTAALHLAEKLTAQDRANTQWQHDLSVSHDRIGDMLIARGDGPGALRAYRKSLAIREALTAHDPANTQWQRDLSVNHNKIGDVLLAQDDRLGALKSYSKSLSIRKELAARVPANTHWERDLSVSHIKIGDALMTRGDRIGALNAYGESLKIARELTTRDPANTQRKRDFAIGNNRIGYVLEEQGDWPGALTAYQKSLEIAEELTARDPANTQWKHDVVMCCVKLATAANGLNNDLRHSCLLRGRDILMELKEAGRLVENQNWIQWFDDQLRQMTGNFSGGSS